MVPPVPITAPDTADVADTLVAAQVLEPARARAVLTEFEAGHESKDGAEFADFLVRQGLLTPFQARTAVSGEAERLSVGPYLLLDSLGGNDLGQVFRAVRRADRARFVVRVVPLRSLWKSREAKRHVARLAALPPHPVLVPLADVDTGGRSHYLAWPFADGESLPHALARHPLPPEFAAKLFADLADGLTLCHAAGVTHGLLRPSAVLIGPDRRPRLLDLGLGDVLADSDDDSLFDTISTSHAAIGRMDFTPPEAVGDPTVRSPAADAYSLGAILYLAVTGEPPFPDGSVVDKMIAHQTRAPLPVRMRNPRVPTPLAGLIERLLAKLPADRPALAEVRDELRAEADATPEPLPLSVTASTLRDAMELSQTVSVRKRSMAERDTEGAVDFDLPPPADPSPAPVAEPVPTPPKSTRIATPPPAPAVLLAAAPRQISLPTAAAPPPSKAVPPVVPTAVVRPADLPRPVGWDAGGPKSDGNGLVVRPPVVVPPPPRRGMGGLLRSLAFWQSQSEVVMLSVFGPPEIAPGQKVKFIAYAHLPEVAENVATLCRAMNKGTELLGAGYTEAAVQRGTHVTLHLTLASAGVAKSTVRFTWVGQPQPKTFDVFVPWESPHGVAAGTLDASLGDEPAAAIPLHFVVLARGR